MCQIRDGILGMKTKEAAAVRPLNTQLGVETFSIHDSGACRRCIWIQTTGDKRTQQPAPMSREFPAHNLRASHTSLWPLFSSSAHHTL